MCITFIYIYTYIYIYIYIYIHTHTHTHIYIHTHLYYVPSTESESLSSLSFASLSRCAASAAAAWSNYDSDMVMCGMYLLVKLRLRHGHVWYVSPGQITTQIWSCVVCISWSNYDSDMDMCGMYLLVKLRLRYGHVWYVSISSSLVELRLRYVLVCTGMLLYSACCWDNNIQCMWPHTPVLYAGICVHVCMYVCIVCMYVLCKHILISIQTHRHEYRQTSENVMLKYILYIIQVYISMNEYKDMFNQIHSDTYVDRCTHKSTDLGAQTHSGTCVYMFARTLRLRYAKISDVCIQTREHIPWCAETRLPYQIRVYVCAHTNAQTSVRKNIRYMRTHT